MNPDELAKLANGGVDHTAMTPYWALVNALIEGVRAMRVGAKEYLPKFPNESDKDYEYRVKTSTMTNVYRDIVENLAAKPFAREVTITDPEKAPDQITSMIEDIDGRGNHLHVFAAEAFFRGINASIHWILVDYPNVDREIVRTVADENALGIRPYWVHIPAENVLDAKTRIRGGIEEIYYIKIFEPGEDADHIRIMERDILGACKFTLYERPKPKDGINAMWREVSSGPITINEIPIVPIIIGRRKGNSFQTYPVLRDAADLQVELYQDETGLKNVKNLTCFPMLAANGIAPDMKEDGKTPKPVPMGPQAVLYAPPNGDGSHGTWERIASDAESLKFLNSEIEAKINRLRELGRQPLTAQSGNITRISAAMAATKGNSAVQAWALALKDALELCFVYTCKWFGLSDTEIEVVVNTDFGLFEEDNNSSAELLLKLKSSGGLSLRTLWSELKRRSILSPEFDADEEDETMANEFPADDPLTGVDPTTGLPKPGVPTPAPKPAPKAA